MAKKIVLFLSPLRTTRAANQVILPPENRYLCPGGYTATGRQTNEAPVKYLLHKYPDISEILCLVSSETRESALEYFTKSIRAASSRVIIRDIPLEIDDDFTKVALSPILDSVQAGDEIFLETTGGPRNAVMDLLLLSRVLSYAGVSVPCAVYSNFSGKTKKIEDVSALFRFFDLVDGMQEMTSFGSVRRLKDYYKTQDTVDPKIRTLLNVMGTLSGDIALCRAEKIDQDIGHFNDALSAVQDCSDPMMRALLPAFRNKFGSSLTTPALIQWCADNNMIQQALTIYRELIPGYILGESGIAELAHIPYIEDSFAGRRTPSVQFLAAFKELEGRSPKKESAWARAGGRWEPRISVLENLHRLLKNSCFRVHCSADQFRTVAMDFYFILALRNMVNHADGTNDSALVDFLCDAAHYKHPSDLKAEEIPTILHKALVHLNQATPRIH